MTEVLERTNGHHPKGRAAPLPAFTFPDSGITVGLRRFSPDLQDTIARTYQRENPPPEVPQVEVDYGEGPVLEPNAADPDYQQAVSSYLQKMTLDITAKMFDLALRRIEVEVDQDAVNQLRADMDAINTPIEEADDRMVYIRYICISSTYDLTSLISYLQRRSMPTEVAVQEFLESFQRRA